MKLLTKKRLARSSARDARKVAKVQRAADCRVRKLVSRMQRRLARARKIATKRVACWLRKHRKSCSAAKRKRLVDRVARSILRNAGMSLSEMKREICEAKKEARKRVCVAKKTAKKNRCCKKKLARKQSRVYRRTLRTGLRAAKEECKATAVTLPGSKRAMYVNRCRSKKARCAKRDARRAARGIGPSTGVDGCGDNDMDALIRAITCQISAPAQAAAPAAAPASASP